VTLEVVVAPGAEPWALTGAEQGAIEALLGGDVEVFYWPRSQAVRVWEQTHDGRPMPGDPAYSDPSYVMRAWARDGRSHILVDRTETKESILWLTLHELSHLELPCSPFLRFAFRSEPRAENYLLDDDAHEARVEEQFANAVANLLAPHFGIARGYDRRWWRTRVNRLEALRAGRKDG